MEDKKNLLTSEESISSVIVSYYLYFLNLLKSHKSFSSDAPRIFIPSLFIWGHISLANLLQRLQHAFDSVNFLSIIIDTHKLGDTEAEINDYLSQKLLAVADKDKTLHATARKHRIRNFLAHNASRFIFFAVCLILVIDFIHVDETNHAEIISFLKRSSVFIILLGLLAKIFGPAIVNFTARMFTGGAYQDNIFSSPMWQKMIRKTSVQLRPFVIVFTQLNVLSSQQIHIVFKLITALQRSGIICIGVGRKDFIISVLKSHQGAVHKDYYGDVYPGIDYGLMQFETLFTINMYLNKRSVNYISGRLNSREINYTDPHLNFPNDQTILPIMQATADPYIALLHMSEANIVGVTESLRLYAAILDINNTSKLTTLLVFILSNRYDPRWLDEIASRLIIKGEKIEADFKGDFFFSKHTKMQQTFIQSLETNKEMIPLLFETFGRVIPQ